MFQVGTIAVGRVSNLSVAESLEQRPTPLFTTLQQSVNEF